MAGGLLTGPKSSSLRSLFVPAVCLLIFFLGYTSQWLFNTAEYLEPGPLTRRETSILNILLICLWWTYYKACAVAPGKYNFPLPKKSDNETDPGTNGPDAADATGLEPRIKARWCKKCNAPKPLRAHHCRHCKTCIPKMDHHCPWTNNCVSLQTFPYFLRFLVYTNVTLWYFIFWLLYPRLRSIFWDNSTLPSYLGPSVPAMVHLVLLAIIVGLVALALFILLVTTVHGWVLNTTMIESWEQERHEAVLLRHRKGGYWSAGDGDKKIRIDPVEFPYDIGFFANMAQAMGTKNILIWLDPFLGGGPKVSKEVGKGTGWEWEENGFNDREGMWPPIDPDKLRRAAGHHGPSGSAAAQREIDLVDKKWANPAEEVAAFRERQEMDLRRRAGTSGVIAELEEEEETDDYEYVDGDSASGGYYDDDYGNEDEDEEDEDEEDEDEDGTAEAEQEKVPVIPGQGYYERGIDGEPGWTNSEGERLRDFGVDEDAEDAEDPDEDVPLGELLRRRKAYGRQEA